MKLDVLALSVVAAFSAAIAAPSRHYEDGIDFSYDSQSKETEIISYLLEIQAKERTKVSPAPPGCHYEGTPPLCIATRCSPGYTDMGLSACGDSDESCCVVGWKLLCCKE